MNRIVIFFPSPVEIRVIVFLVQYRLRRYVVKPSFCCLDDLLQGWGCPLPFALLEGNRYFSGGRSPCVILGGQFFGKFLLSVLIFVGFVCYRLKLRRLTQSWGRWQGVGELDRALSFAVGPGRWATRPRGQFLTITISSSSLGLLEEEVE